MTCTMDPAFKTAVDELFKIDLFNDMYTQLVEDDPWRTELIAPKPAYDGGFEGDERDALRIDAFYALQTLNPNAPEWTPLQRW